MYGRVEAMNTYFYYRYTSVDIYYTSGEIFKGTDTNYYIGNVSDFVFLYNENDASTTAVQMSNVDKIVFK